MTITQLGVLGSFSGGPGTDLQISLVGSGATVDDLVVVLGFTGDGSSDLTGGSTIVKAMDVDLDEHSVGSMFALSFIVTNTSEISNLIEVNFAGSSFMDAIVLGFRTDVGFDASRLIGTDTQSPAGFSTSFPCGTVAASASGDAAVAAVASNDGQPSVSSWTNSFTNRVPGGGWFGWFNCADLICSGSSVTTTATGSNRDLRMGQILVYREVTGAAATSAPPDNNRQRRRALLVR